MPSPDAEISRLFDLMPASGRMFCELVSKPDQESTIATQFPLPWKRDRQVSINFDLWSELPQPQRDLLFLRTVCWVTGIRWFQLDWKQGLLLAGLVGTGVELLQGDAVGTVSAGALSAIAALQIWRTNRSAQQEIEADEAAVRVAARRGYGESEAARHLINAIETAARIENRFGLDFTELLRCQNLRTIAGLSAVAVPENLRENG